MAAFGHNCTLRDTWVGLSICAHCGVQHMPPAPDWRSAAAYAYLDDLKPAELAWEFLRRNSDYRRDYRAVADVGVGQAEFSEPLILRWGLPFPDRSGPTGG